MNRIFLIFLIIVSSCILCFSQNDSVIYRGSGSYFVFYSDSTYKLINMPCDICPAFADNNNLLSFGRYVKFKNKAIYLYSDTSLNDVEMNVVESKDQTPYFKIHIETPAQEDSLDMLRPHYFYALRIFYKRICKDSVNYFHQEYYQNEPQFTIPKDSTIFISNITVCIYPKESAKGKPFTKNRYIVKSNINNIFTISFPQFVTGYLDYLRMFHYRLDIFNKRLIGDSFHQSVYVREDVYIKRKYSSWFFPVCPSWQYKVSLLNTNK